MDYGCASPMGPGSGCVDLTPEPIVRLVVESPDAQWVTRVVSMLQKVDRRMSDLSPLHSHLRIPSMRERVSPTEWQTRVDLAACYRLVHHYGMDDLVYNHISARVPGEEGHFLINAYGMTYDEITASSLVKIDFDGRWCRTRAPATASTTPAS